MRVNLKGIAKVSKKLADGSTRIYYYAWRGGPLLKDAEGNALSDKNDPQFLVAFAKAHAGRKAGVQGVLKSLLTLWQGTDDFKKLSEKTRTEYRRYIDLIDKEFGDMPLAALESPKARGKFKEWRDGMGATRKADYAWSTLARALSVAKDRGKISVNPCERGGRVYAADRAEKIWSSDQITKFLSVASQPLQMAMLLALWTGQRQGDLLKLTWHSYDGSFIRLKQGKKGKNVRIPVSGVLKSVLDDLKAQGMGNGRILRNTFGEDWTEDGFRTSWGKAYIKADLPKGDDALHFHDLRGTAVTRLALAGCSTSQIASVTGHSLTDVESLLDAHYLGGRFELAEQAMTLLEKHQGALLNEKNAESDECATGAA